MSPGRGNYLPETVRRLPVDIRGGIDTEAVRSVLRESPVDPQRHDEVADVIRTVVDLARRFEARSFEINPLVVTAEEKVVAAGRPRPRPAQG